MYTYYLMESGLMWVVLLVWFVGSVSIMVKSKAAHERLESQEEAGRLSATSKVSKTEAKHADGKP
jgi:hypothetical protein